MRLLGAAGALWAVLCGLLFGTAAVCVGGLVYGGLAVWLVVRGVSAICPASAAGGAVRPAPARRPALEV